MPAKVGDPVNIALSLSLAARDSPGELDKRLVSTASQVLSSKIEYEKSETFNKSVLDSLKHKYVTINTESSVINGRPPTPHSLDTSVSGDMRPEPDSVLPTPNRILFPAERVQLGWRGSYPVGSGMLNVGNTCYLNATLQALFHIPALVNWLQSDSSHLNKCNITNGSLQTECLICAVNKTLKASQNKSGNVIKPYLIINRLKSICKHMGHGQQEDAHEFLRYLIENMGEAFLVRYRGEKIDSYSKETTPLNQILGGYMRTEVNCLQCRGVSTTFQHFQELLLDIRRASTLDDALAAYFQRERLDGDDAYRCERCHKKVSATKKFSIEKPPHVLCIQLKRFSVVGVKLNKHVSFTQRLDLTRFLCPQSSYKLGNQPLVYKLVSMVTHMGSSVHCGHYTAIAQTSTGHFYHFDDSSVRPISLNAALDTNTYIIIYEMERIDVRPPQGFNSTPKPATITSGSPAVCNGTARRSMTLPSLGSSTPSLKIEPVLSPLLQKPGPSIIPVVHKQNSPVIIPAVHKQNSSATIPTKMNLGLPPAKDRDRVTFGLQPRLVMPIKIGKVCQPTGQDTTKSSLVPYESGDSSGSENERSVKKPDMPILETTPSPSRLTLSLVKHADGSKSPSTGIFFHRKSEEFSIPSSKIDNSIILPPKSPSSKIMELSKVKTSVKSPSVNSDTARNEGSKNIMLSPTKIPSDSLKVRKLEGDSCVRRKGIDAEPLSKCASNDVLDKGAVDSTAQTLQVNTSVSSASRGKPLSAGWQVINISSCFSESSTTIDASSIPSPSKANLSLSKHADGGKSPSSGIFFHRKSEESSTPSSKINNSIVLPPKGPSPKIMELSKVKMSVKSDTTLNKGSENVMLSPTKIPSDSLKVRKLEGDSCVRRKGIDAEPLSKCVNNGVLNEGAVDSTAQTLQVNTSLSSAMRNKSVAAGWQVTDISCFVDSHSCHSESSTNSVASSTMSWSVSDVKRPPKRLPLIISDTFVQSRTHVTDKVSSASSKYQSDTEISRLSPCSTRANSMERLAIIPQKAQWEVGLSVPGVHRRGPSKEEKQPLTLKKTAPDSKIETSHKDWNQNIETKALNHCNGGGGGDSGSREGNDSDEYEWVEKTHESLGLARCNGQLNGWDSSKNRGDVANHLVRHSHQGYGPSVKSWTEGRAHVDREVDNERREERKRLFDKQYDEELDMGRVKKVKHRNEFDVNRHKPNCFEEYRKSWNRFQHYDPLQSRKMFYNKRYRNNHYNNGYHRKQSTHHRSYYKPNHWRR